MASRGAVYPMAVYQLAPHYRFRRIGGSSAGAIAAVLTAAAEYGRRQNRDAPMAGFDAVSRIPRVLADGNTLLQLFQPSPDTRAVFEFVMVIIDKSRSALARVLAALLIIVRSAWWVFLPVLLLALTPGLVSAVCSPPCPASDGCSSSRRSGFREPSCWR